MAGLSLACSLVAVMVVITTSSGTSAAEVDQRVRSEVASARETADQQREAELTALKGSHATQVKRLKAQHAANARRAARKAQVARKRAVQKARDEGYASGRAASTAATRASTSGSSGGGGPVFKSNGPQGPGYYGSDGTYYGMTLPCGDGSGC